MERWKHKFISKAGKLTLLKKIAQVIPNFWMSLFLLPNEICDGIEKLMNGFWWGNGGNSKGIKWVPWEKLCVVKVRDGLRFKNLRNFNITMLANKRWKLINIDNSHMTDYMRAKYFPNSDFLNAKLGRNPSYM